MKKRLFDIILMIWSAVVLFVFLKDFLIPKFIERSQLWRNVVPEKVISHPSESISPGCPKTVIPGDRLSGNVFLPWVEVVRKPAFMSFLRKQESSVQNTGL